jgi:hypothetical protein
MRGRAVRVQRVMQAQQGFTDGAGGADHGMKDGDGNSFDNSLSRALHKQTSFFSILRTN